MVDVMRAGVGDAVRQGSFPNNPNLVLKYLNSVDSLSNVLNSDRERVSLYFNTVQVLLDTICDTYISRDWRKVCYDHLYRPLLRLDKLVSHTEDTTRFARLKIEMNTLVPYFL